MEIQYAQKFIGQFLKWYAYRGDNDIRKIKPTKEFVTEEGLALGHPKEFITVAERSKVKIKLMKLGFYYG